MAKSVFIGFDFSMNKPAMTILFDKKFYFFIWPANLDKKKIALYEESGVYVKSRNLQAVSTKDKNSQIVLEHTIRSTELANLIIEDIDRFLNQFVQDDNIPIYVSSEGLAYNSSGDAALNLATYKGVLLSKLYEHYFGRLYGMYTYPPISIKAVAGCAKKDSLKDKTKMIKAFMQENITNKFKENLCNGAFIAKTNFIQCVDDIVDSYWALKTMLVKEKI